MTDLQATLDAIDELAVQQCAHCSRPLSEDGQSLDFCDDECQREWIAGRNEIVELIGYREPSDLAAHWSNQVELYSPEVTPPSPEHRLLAGDAIYTLTADTTQLGVAFEDMRRAIEDMRQRVTEGFARIWEDLAVRPHFVIFDEIPHFSLSSPATEPIQVAEGEPFDPDYEYDWRPIPALHESEPLPPVMAASEADWQSLVDASRPQVAFAHTEHRPRARRTR